MLKLVNILRLCVSLQFSIIFLIKLYYLKFEFSTPNHLPTLPHQGKICFILNKNKFFSLIKLNKIAFLNCFKNQILNVTFK